MAKLPEPVLDDFLKGNHVMRHQPGIWNGIWSDMYIESTFMRYGHGPGGIIGITLKPKALKRWALGLHICSQLTKDIAAIREGNDQTTVTVHKEEMPSRKQTDAADRQHIREKLGISIDPLQPNGHPKGLINIVTGKVAPESVNVDRSVQIGTQQMREYEASWPDGFHKPLAKQVITISASRKHIKVGHVPVYDTTLIYSRVLALQKVRDIDLESVLKYELAPVPTSMFDINGDMRITKSKSTLKKKLQVEVSDRQSHPPDSIILDGCAVLWVINWPTHGTVEDYIKNLLSYLIECQKKCSTYLVFDRYYDNSIKTGTRNARAGKDASRQHQLLLGTPLPSQKVTLTVSSNKVQLIKLICIYLRDHADMLPQNGNSLVITGPDPTPVQICDEQVIQRIDLRTTHEEADVVIIQQVLYLASIGIKNIRVVADDTDIFVLLLFYYATRQLTCNVVMAGTRQGRTTIDIKATVNNNRDIIPDLLAAHVLSGCDTVAYLWGVGKVTVLKVLSSGKHLTKLGQLPVEMADVIDEATHFVAACYSSPDSADMTALRYSVWSTKMSNPKLSSAPDLKTLPPTTAAFVEHVKRAHLQVAIWKAAMDADPPSLDPVQYGWSLDAASGILVPVSLPPDVSPAPDDVLKLIKCGCASSTPCSTSRCSCSAAQLSCSMFCSCHATNDCRNGHTRVADAAADDEIYEDESNM